VEKERVFLKIHGDSIDIILEATAKIKEHGVS
jgi:hypothetical protein